MTGSDIAGRVYIEPLTCESLAAIIEEERPQGLLPTLGGQTGLNLACLLADEGVLERFGVEMLGASLESILMAEDRELFKATMLSIGEPVPLSATVVDLDNAFSFARKTGYPIIVRPAFTLGGTGGMARTEEELAVIVGKGLKVSPIGQVLLEKSVAGWKEIEYEVMRDGQNNCVTICIKGNASK